MRIEMRRTARLVRAGVGLLAAEIAVSGRRGAGDGHSHLKGLPSSGDVLVDVFELGGKAGMHLVEPAARRAVTSA